MLSAQIVYKYSMLVKKCHHMRKSSKIDGPYPWMSVRSSKGKPDGSSMGKRQRGCSMKFASHQKTEAQTTSWSSVHLSVNTVNIDD